MCGIAGYVGIEPVDPRRVRRALTLMGRRGPDHAASVTVDAGGRQICLLHSRLGIIDLDPRSNQPFTRDGCTVVFNGEIYNYRELRAELAAAGVVFETASDTEVLLRCYEVDGPECVQRFEGMWSFAIWDARRQQVFLSRDRFGKKPLYYRLLPGGIIFGSEVKLIRALSAAPPAFNDRHLLRYLARGYKALYHAGETFFEGVTELPSAASMVIDRGGTFEVRRHWAPDWAPRPMTFEDSVSGLRERLIGSVRQRLHADVPLAFCLSGGVDSAALASIAARQCHREVHAFSVVDTDPRYDERRNIAATVDDLGCRHTAVHLTPASTLDDLRQWVAYHDAPLHTISYYVHAGLCRAMAEQGYRVAVSGIGADELVTGYYDHFLLHLQAMNGRPQFGDLLDAWSRHVRPRVRNAVLRNPRLYLERPGFRDHVWAVPEAARLCLKPEALDAVPGPPVEQQFCDSLLRNRMLNELFLESVPVLLHDEDRNSMFYSIENRSPYLDRRVAEFAGTIPLEHLIRDGYAKVVLREAMGGILNDRVRLDRRKVGFNAALSSVFDVRGPEVRDALLADGPLNHLVHRPALEALVARGSWTNAESKFLFAVLNARVFLEQPADHGAATARREGSSISWSC